jgi:predicted transcriptional regulator
MWENKMAKRGRLEIIYDILTLVKESNNGIKTTPLLRKSNLSTSRFKEYYSEILEKEFVREFNSSDGKKVLISEKGLLFLDKYRAITGFVDEFGL